MDEGLDKLIAECRRQEESCLYTSTTLFEWRKALHCWRIAFVVVPIILSTLATWQLLDKAGHGWITGTCAMLAGLIPAIYKALNFDVNLEALAKQAHEFKTLQDRFRQAANIVAMSGVEELRAELARLMNRMDTARANSLTAPERFFRRAQRKIAAGDYTFTADTPQVSGQTTR